MALLFLLMAVPMSTVIIFGNLLTICAYARERRLRSNKANMFITSLAVADLLVGAITVPIITTIRILNMRSADGNNLLPNSTCDPIYFANWIFVGVTFWHLVVISADRYLKITLLLVSSHGHASQVCHCTCDVVDIGRSHVHHHDD